ncbi:MAG: tetratricopeptide repeat protein [Okeania sp. SIO3C4]|nr:tetratricopeptide repeat protein [Okeania sp. SIO3B3]NER06155.1 tetratricopeptide repeat protein [Okeania sp. SIO3C4]
MSNEAEELLQKALEETEDGNFEEGLAALDKAFELEPDYFNQFVPINTRGSALLGLERYEEALAMYEQALEQPEDSFDTYTGLRNKGLTLSALEKYEAAIECHNQALEWYETSVKEGKALRDRDDLAPLWEDKGWALINFDEYDEAMICFDKAIECIPDDGWLLYNKVCCYALQNKIDQALKSLEQAINLEPEVKDWVKEDPDCENLSSDPQFQALVSS